MSPPSPTSTTPDPTADHAAWAEGVLRRQVEVLEAFAAAGLRMALAIEQQVTEAGEPAAPAEAVKAFDRMWRAVRLTALVQSKLVQDIGRVRSWADLTGGEAREAARAEAKARLDPAYGHKARVEAIVARVARAEHEDDEDRVERLVRETCERLDDEDIYGKVLDRPVGELVALLCRDLGLTPDWKRLAQEAWAQAEAAQGDRRSPFAPASPIERTGGLGPMASPLACDSS